jgi:hypothetical protein
MRSGNDLVGFFVGFVLGFVNDGRGTSLSIGQTTGSFRAVFRQLDLDMLVRIGEFDVCVFRGFEAMGDFFSTFIQRICDGWPHEFHREPHQDGKHNRLNKQGCVDTHVNTSLWAVG